MKNKYTRYITIKRTIKELRITSDLIVFIVETKDKPNYYIFSSTNDLKRIELLRKQKGPFVIKAEMDYYESVSESISNNIDISINQPKKNDTCNILNSKLFNLFKSKFNAKIIKFI